MKILVIDDEKYIRLGVMTILEKSGLAIENIDEARNGEEGYEKIKLNAYDLVISDIRMPKLTGIQLIEIIDREKDALKKIPDFIFMSGYNDFQYAKTAIKYGVKAYLLKPINKEELINEVSKSSLNISKKKVNTQKVCPFMNPDYLWQNHPDFVVDDSYLFGMSLYKTFPRHMDQSQMEEVMQSIKGYMESSNTVAYTGLSKNNRMFFIAESNEMLLEIDNMLRVQLFEGRICALSKDILPFEQLQNTYEKLSALLQYSKVISKNIIYLEDISYRINYPCDFMGIIKQLSGMIHGERAALACEVIANVFSAYALKHYTLIYFDQWLYHISEYIVRPMLDYLPQGYESIRTNFYNLTDYESYESILEYQLELVSFVHCICSEIKSIKIKKMKYEKISKAMAYIEMHYDNPNLNMAVLSNEISLNYTYFSQLFKEESGQNFTEFLSRLRIQKAKEMLLKTDKKVYEICQLVGYNDTKHFQKCFSQYEGFSPNAYRKKMAYEKTN